jgi:hypothetical protein
VAGPGQALAAEGQSDVFDPEALRRMGGREDEYHAETVDHYLQL